MEILGKSVVELLDMLKKKTISSQELFSFFSQRIQAHDQQINSFVTKLDTSANTQEGSLSGIPLAIKDNFCTQGIRTTASSKVLDAFVPPYESTVTDKLKSAGVTVLGKTNMDAWAHGSSTETSDYGPTKNPWNLAHAPGGSSGGSAAAVAAGLAPAAIGSETAGSIRQPASWSGIVGLKPTYGRVSRYGVVAMGSSFDCPGPMTSTVEDAALLLSTIAGPDPYDATTSSLDVPNYTENLKTKTNYVIGVADEYFEDVESDTADMVKKTIEAMEKAGHTVKRVKLMHPKYAISVYTILQRSEVSSNLGRYTGVRYGNSRDDFGAEAKRRIMLGTYTLSHGYYDAYYKKAAQVRAVIKQDFADNFKNVDFILAPTTPMTALKLGEWENYSFFGEQMDVLTEPAAVAGLPAINIPIGLDSKGLPVGIQVMAKHFDEARMLNVAWLIEQQTGFRELWVKWLEETYS